MAKWILLYGYIDFRMQSMQLWTPTPQMIGAYTPQVGQYWVSSFGGIWKSGPMVKTQCGTGPHFLKCKGPPISEPAQFCKMGWWSLSENEILLAIRNFDPDMCLSMTLLKRDHHKRFIAGLPPSYQEYIEANIPLNSYNVAIAREHAGTYTGRLVKQIFKPASTRQSNKRAIWRSILLEILLFSLPTIIILLPTITVLLPTIGYHLSSSVNPRYSADEHRLATEKRFSLSDGQWRFGKHGSHEERHHGELHYDSS